MNGIAPELVPLLAVVAATLDEDGTLIEANAGFLRLIEMADVPPHGVQVARFFIQPDFASLVGANPGADGEIHCGLLTLGEYGGKTRSLRGRVWRAAGQLGVLAEYDIEEMERLGDTVLELNSDYALAQFELARSNIKMRHLNAELEQQVAQRTQVLRDALLGAEAASRAKSVFLRNMSHELRTPLNAILGLGYIVGRKIAEPELRRQVEQITDAGRRLLVIVDQIMDLSRLETGTFEIEARDFALLAVVDVTVNVLRQRAAAKGLLLVQEIDPVLPLVLRGDPMRLSQILTDLIGNAIKFSERGRIAVRANLVAMQDDDFLLRFEVEDQGIGIAEAQQALLFNAFEQADHSTTRKYGGAGLGLAICRHLAYLMGGEVGVDSTPGLGSTFWFTARLQRGHGVMPGESATMAGAATGLATGCQGSAPDAVLAGWPAVPANGREFAADHERALTVLAHLEPLLASDDTAAGDLFEANRPLLHASLGAGAIPLERQVMNFDYPAALATLREMMERGETS
ncbi:MAG: hypothetical protein IPP85_13305 [Propionivibrio sp.]|nr:hypothetical protein [Propionivibrio sp.]